MRRMLQGRAGMAVAFLLGLLIATAGTATAAKLITGKQIKDGSISRKDLSKAVRLQLARAGVGGPKGDTGATGAKGDAGAKGEPGPSTGPAGGALAGSYPNPTLRPPQLVSIKQQQPPPAPSIDCEVVFDTFCGDANTGNYWNDPVVGAGYLAYDVEPSGSIQFRGGVQLVGTASSFLVFVLPPGRRPATRLSVPITHVGNLTAADALFINTDGEVRITSVTAANGAVWDLTSVRFRIGG